MKNALEMKAAIKGDQLLLVDNLTPGQQNNPAWCTYGPCPNCSFLIDQTGKIVEAFNKTPKNMLTMETAIKKLLK